MKRLLLSMLVFVMLTGCEGEGGFFENASDKKPTKHANIETLHINKSELNRQGEHAIVEAWGYTCGNVVEANIMTLSHYQECYRGAMLDISYRGTIVEKETLRKLVQKEYGNFVKIQGFFKRGDFQAIKFIDDGR